MSLATPQRYDLRWTPASLAVTVLLCAAFAAALAVRHHARPVRAGRQIPPNLRRLQAATQRINPNSASLASLQRLSGIGPARARDIVAYRQAHGPSAFRSADDLAAVKGIGPATVARLAPHLCFPPDGAPATRPTTHAAEPSLRPAPLTSSPSAPP